RIAGLGITVVRHELRADRADVRRDVVVEQRPGAGNAVRHHELADELVLVGKAVRMLVGRRVQKDARILPRPGGENDDARFLRLFLLLGVVIFDAGNPRAVLIGEDARHGAKRPHLGAALAGFTEIGDDRIGERADRAADVTPAVIDAGIAALEL